MPKHVSVNDAAGSFLASAPAFTGAVTATVTATAGTLGRFVFGSLNLTATVSNAASVACEIETGVGTGVYQTLQNTSIAAGITSAFKRGFGFFCPSGFRYRFTKGNLAGTTETFDVYNFVDLG